MPISPLAASPLPACCLPSRDIDPSPGFALEPDPTFVAPLTAGCQSDDTGDHQARPRTVVDFDSRIRTRSNLRASTADGATFGFMVGAGETYFAAFALAVGLGEVSAGLVSSLPLLAGGILQLISLRAMVWVGSEKRWVVLCAAMQGLAFLPLFYASLSGSLSLGTLLLIASVYWAGGLASGPAWNTWMESIVPGKIRPKYFAQRTRISQLTTLIGLVGGGMLLQWAQSNGRALQGFACVFAAAGLFRMWSVFWLTRHHTPRFPSRLSQSKPAQPLAATTGGDGALSGLKVSGIRLLAYLVMVQGMVQISGPYFASYMLEELQYTYGQFVTLLALGFLAKVAALSWWVKVAHRGGAKMLLWIGGVGIVPMSSLWIVSQNYYWLATVQILSGTLWAAYELGFFLLFFEALPVAQRTRMLTYYNLANTTAWCAGALVGAWLLKSSGLGESGYYLLFAVSSLGRLAALGLLFGASLNSVPVMWIRIRVLGVRPNSAMVDSPILPTLDQPDPSATDASATDAEPNTVPVASAIAA